MVVIVVTSEPHWLQGSAHVGVVGGQTCIEPTMLTILSL
jgi:hypothetical protein